MSGSAFCLEAAPPEVGGCCCWVGHVRKDAILRGEMRVWERNGMSRWKSGWKRHTAKNVLTRCVTPAHRGAFPSTQGDGVSGSWSHFFTSRKNSHKVWCCLVQVAWFAVVITSADRLDLQTSILLISPLLRICTAKRVWIAGNIIDICWYCPRLSSSVCYKVKPGCSFPRQRFSQHFFTWTYDRNTAGCLVSLLGFLVSWLQILAFDSALQCRLDVASLSSVPGGSLQIPSL